MTLPSSSQTASFGPFRLFPAERRLEKSGDAIRLGSRAMDLLIALVDRAGAVLTKQDLLEHVWQGMTVDERNIRYQMTVLRKVLDAGEEESAYVSTVQGRGYSFVAPVTRAPGRLAAPSHQTPAICPRPVGKVVGRETSTRDILALLESHTFVSIIGPGGVGKTTSALEVAQLWRVSHDGSVGFADLGTLNDPALVPMAVAVALGLRVESSDVVAALITDMRNLPALLILDCCEPAIEIAAALSERLLQSLPLLRILTTSREALRAEGETIYRLPPLDCPDAGLTQASEIIDFSAVRLFIERAAPQTTGLSDADVLLVGEICRKLDGLPLAIHLVAGRVHAFGIPAIAAQLGQFSGLNWKGRRTALPRHKNLAAMLDWSFSLLADTERNFLIRLAAFTGGFTLQAALAVAADPAHAMDASELLGGLVEKSLIVAQPGNDGMRYRLLDIMRAYVLKLYSVDVAQCAASHARYYAGLLRNSAQPMPEGRNPNLFVNELGNLRAALDWAFSRSGALEIAIPVASTASAIMLDLGLLSECRIWAERALQSLPRRFLGTELELELQASLGLSLLFTAGDVRVMGVALERGLALAESLGDPRRELRQAAALHMYAYRTGRLKTAEAMAERGAAIAKRLPDSTAKATASWMLGMSHSLFGRHSESRWHSENALAQLSESSDTSLGISFDHRLPCLCILARSLWFQGFAAQALAVSRRTFEMLALIRQPNTQCLALIYMGFVHLWSGDLAELSVMVDRLCGLAELHHFPTHAAVGGALRGAVLVRQGKFDEGNELLQQALRILQKHGAMTHVTALTCELADGLMLAGALAAADRLAKESLAEVAAQGGSPFTPELLRIAACIEAARTENTKACRAPEMFEEAIAAGREAGALSLELRASISAAEYLKRQGAPEKARKCLVGIYDRFTEGFETADLRRTSQLLDAYAPVRSVQNSRTAPA